MPVCTIGSKKVCKPGQCFKEKVYSRGQEGREHGHHSQDESFGKQPSKDCEVTMHVA